MDISILSIQEIVSAFMVLFAVIDITGSVPIIIDIQNKHHKINAAKAALFSFLILFSFLFVGDALLGLFSVDISSFAVAGALVIFVLAVEMIFGIEIFKNDGPADTATIVPLVFPLIAGAGTLTTLLALKAEYHTVNIIIALILNIIVVYLVLKNVSLVEKIFGKGGVYILRKFFGIILLAISVKLFTSNLTSLIETLNP
ncbi:MarC family protein [uncultured Sanguibacteroides sp.]|uniref:MarC family protein n=1 Tax=uncultured Sanguibacteroides sp. TaxID=1635151 RepID=UPI0025E1A480|nr:MarC family protein [uncultured Sanguibacteroides sp.]